MSSISNKPGMRLQFVERNDKENKPASLNKLRSNASAFSSPLAVHRMKQSKQAAIDRVRTIGSAFSPTLASKKRRETLVQSTPSNGTSMNKAIFRSPARLKVRRSVVRQLPMTLKGPTASRISSSQSLIEKPVLSPKEDLPFRPLLNADLSRLSKRVKISASKKSLWPQRAPLRVVLRFVF